MSNYKNFPIFSGGEQPKEFLTLSAITEKKEYKLDLKRYKIQTKKQFSKMFFISAFLVRQSSVPTKAGSPNEEFEDGLAEEERIR